MKSHGDQQTFRAWLVKQLTLTRWSLPLHLSEKDTAKQLGITIDVLREAQASRDAELKRRGHGGISRGKRRYVGQDYSIVEVRMPPSIDKVWRDTCQVMGLARATVLRSLIHHFLLHPTRPAVTAQTWLYRGKVCPITHAKMLAPAQTRITRGAQIALDAHAETWRVTTTGVVRGVITEFLEGRLRKFKIVSSGEIWGDADRYLHPEKFNS